MLLEISLNCSSYFENKDISGILRTSEPAEKVFEGVKSISLLRVHEKQRPRKNLEEKYKSNIQDKAI